MQLMEAIHTRRSIRKFTDKDVPDAAIKQILEAAMMAPSAGNAQPWQFVVTTDRERLDATQHFHPHLKMVAQAPVGILLCGDLSLEKYPGFWVQDCSAAMQNMLLAIHDLGLGAVWTGVYPDKGNIQKFSDLFNLPTNVVPLGFVPLGWPDQHPKSTSRYKQDRVHYETYSKS